MRDFISRHASKIIGVLKGFDRLLFRGHLRSLCHAEGVMGFLYRQGVRLVDFGDFVEKTTELLRDAGRQVAKEVDRPFLYLTSSAVRKEDIARDFLRKQPAQDGLICLLECVEACSTWEIHRSRATKSLELQRKNTRCKHQYFYWLDPDFGLCHLRLQLWMPYTVQICMNGREWLSRQLDPEGLVYRRADNCFLELADPERSQQLMHQLRDLAWTRYLDRFLAPSNPMLPLIGNHADGHYYWTLHQCEYATDVMFRRPADLAALYPRLARYAISDLGSHDTMRFLGKRLVTTYRGEVVTDYKHRPEGICVRHRAGHNSVKMYDKQGSVLRIETTTNDPSQFKSRRRAQGNPDSERKLRPLRKGVADVKPRAVMSSQVNDRYLEALATVDEDKSLQDILADLLRPAQLGHRRVRALRPWSDPDLPLLRAISNADHLVRGFRNRDIAAALTPEAATDPEAHKKASARVTRLLRLLQAHGLIRKIEGTHQYLLTAKGRIVTAAVLAASAASASKLRAIA